MRTLLLLILTIGYVIHSNHLRAQNEPVALGRNEYGGYMSAIYLYNQGNARSEAMGRTACTNGNSVLYGLHNPALINRVKTLDTQVGFIFPVWPYRASLQMNLGAAGRISSRWAGSFAYQKNIYDKLSDLYSMSPGTADVQPSESRLHLATAYRVWDQSRHKLDAGLGMNVSKRVNNIESIYKGVTVDLGINYQLEIDTANTFSAGLSLNNVTNQKIWLKKDAENSDKFIILPQILRIGAAYTYKPVYLATDLNLNLFEVTIAGEFNEMINSDYFTMVKMGLELKWLEIGVFRAGYYKGNLASFGSDQAYPSSDDYRMLTYGAGLEFPIEKLRPIRNGLKVGLDIAALPFFGFEEYPSYIYEFQSKRFYMINARLEWHLKK